MRARKLCSIAVVGLLCTIGAVNASTASAATWTGTARGQIDPREPPGQRRRDLGGELLVQDRSRGRRPGRGRDRYEPSIDASGLNSAIGYVRDVTGAALDILGKWGAAVRGAALTQIVGTNVSFREPSPFERTADVRNGQAVSVHQPAPANPGKPGGVRRKTGSYWVATRVR